MFRYKKGERKEGGEEVKAMCCRATQLGLILKCERRGRWAEVIGAAAMKQNKFPSQEQLQ